MALRSTIEETDGDAAFLSLADLPVFFGVDGPA
jgi:hypothetical protein